MLISSSATLTITDLLRGDIQLASPPTIYFALKKVIDDPNKSALDAAAIIDKDAALAAKLLKIVNSAFYGFASEISTVSRAITLVGTRELQNLVLATVIMDRFSDLPGQLFSIHDFWARNLRCALIAREVDAIVGKKYSETAFICGLLHNLGQLVLYRRIPVLAREVDLLIQSQQPADIDEARIERQVIGFDHFQLGADLCRLWKLPELIIESINLHSYADHLGRYADIAAITRLAHHYSRVDTPFDAIVANSLPVSPEQIGQVLDKTHDEFEAVFKLFYP